MQTCVSLVEAAGFELDEEEAETLSDDGLFLVNNDEDAGTEASNDSDVVWDLAHAPAVAPPEPVARPANLAHSVSCPALSQLSQTQVLCTHDNSP